MASTGDDCDDAELIDEACQGSERAFRRLVECNQDRLVAMMFRLLGCHEDAEEAVQEAFIRAFTRIDQFNSDSKFSIWMYRIAFNSAISSRRKNRPTLSLDQRIDEAGLDAVDKKASQVDASLLRQEEIQLIHNALDKLSEDHRIILVLRELDDLAYDDISAVLNISVGTVRSRLSRARGNLREVIEAIQHNVNNRS